MPPPVRELAGKNFFYGLSPQKTYKLCTYYLLNICVYFLGMQAQNAAVQLQYVAPKNNLTPCVTCIARLSWMLIRPTLHTGVTD